MLFIIVKKTESKFYLQTKMSVKTKIRDKKKFTKNFIVGNFVGKQFSWGEIFRGAIFPGAFFLEPNFRRLIITLVSRLNVSWCFLLKLALFPEYPPLFYSVRGQIRKKQNTLRARLKLNRKWYFHSDWGFLSDALAHTQRKTKILRIKNISIDVHRIS